MASVTSTLITQHVLSVLAFELSLEDANALKAAQAIAIDLNSTFVAMTDGTVDDMAGEPVVALANSNALVASDYTRDATEPMFDSVDLRMPTG